jgi:KDO2-lipid IV(A) lauroyltransferase
VPFLSSAEVRALVPMETLEPMRAALARGKGVIIVSAHLGNWELLARRIAMEGIPIKVVTRQSPDPAFNAITDSLRENAGYTVHPRGSSPRGLLKHLRENGVVAILADQKADDGVMVPFFGQSAGTVAGPAVLALKTGAAILPLFAPRRPDGTFGTVFLPEIDTTPSGDTAADVARIMGDVTAAIESAVRQYPDQWLWLHDRWRLPAAKAAMPYSRPTDAAPAPSRIRVE